MDHKKVNKKRKPAPLVTHANKVPKIAEATAPKIESVDVPTTAPKIVPKATTAKPPVKAPTKPKKVLVDSGPSAEIKLSWVDRTPNAKLETKAVPLPPDTTGPKTPGIQIIDKPTINSESKCKEFLKWFLWPLPIEEFFNSFWEKRTFVLKRHMPQYWDGWFSSDKVRELLEMGQLHYGSDIDVTLYKNGQRFTLNMGGDDPAHPDVVWDLFEKQKCSVRVLRPQEYSDNVSRMLALLEESFLSGFGSNAYYTPAGSQGFAPHWDDVEAFVLQLEGKKHWKIHGLGGDEELLPRFSSRNFSQEEVGDSVMEVILEPGDIMYFPRGTIHQAQSDPDSDSFHLTVSCAQKNCWADLLDVALTAAMIQASKNMVEFRESLPRDYGNYMGIMHSDLEKHDKRKAFLTKAMALCEAFYEKFLPQQIDDAADKMMCRFLYDRQPPQAMLSLQEQGITDADNEDDMDVESSAKPTSKSSKSEAHSADDDEEITEHTKIRIISKHCVRLVVEENASLYYASENTTKHHEVDSMKIAMPLHYAEAVEFLMKEYPKYVAVGDLPLESEEERMDLANELLDHQIAMVE